MRRAELTDGAARHHRQRTGRRETAEGRGRLGRSATHRRVLLTHARSRVILGVFEGWGAREALTIIIEQTVRETVTAGTKCGLDIRALGG